MITAARRRSRHADGSAFAIARALLLMLVMAVGAAGAATAWGQTGDLRQQLKIPPVPEDLPPFQMPFIPPIPGIPGAENEQPGPPPVTPVTESYVRRIGFDPDLTTLDIYARQGLFTQPVILAFHGGKWRFGGKSDLAAAGQAMADRGFVFVAANYRRAPAVRFPGPVQDAEAALAYVRGTIRRHGGDPGQIALLGVEAGAQIVARLAVDADRLGRALGSLRLRKVILIGGDAFDVRLRFDDPTGDKELTAGTSHTDLRLAFGTGVMWDDASATRALRRLTTASELPPFLLVHDQSAPRIVLQNEVFAEALAAKGVPVTRIDTLSAREVTTTRSLQALTPEQVERLASLLSGR